MLTHTPPDYEPDGRKRAREAKAEEEAKKRAGNANAVAAPK